VYAAIRTYGVADAEELSELVREEFLPIVETVPGFVAYYVLDAGEGVLSSITICEDEAGLDESTSRAGAWVEERALDLVESGPTIVTGTIAAERTREGLPAQT